MNEIEQIIYIELQKRPGEIYITPEGLDMYALIQGGMLHFTGENFKQMSGAEVNKFIVDKLNEAANS